MEVVKIADHKRFQANGNAFIFLTQMGTVFEIDSEIQAVLDHGLVKGCFTEKQFYSSLNGTIEDKKAHWNTLTKNRIFVPHTVPENGGATPTAQPTRPIPIKTLVLHVTQACNLGCHYCYHGFEDGIIPLSAPLPMSLIVAKKAVDFLIEMSGTLKDLVLVFFGGEPLLNYKLISKIVDYADENASRSDKKIDYAITTNGSLLNPKIISFLNDRRIGTTISLDGNKAQHDRFRRFPDNSPSYDIIEPKVRAFLDSRPPKPVVARVTLVKDIEDIESTLYHLLDLGFTEVGFAPVTSNASDFQLDARQMERLLEQFQKLSEAFVRMARKGQFLGFTNLVDLLVTIHEGEVKHYPCGAGIGMFSVDPEGGLFLCQRLTGEDSAMMGDVFAGADQKKLEIFRREAGLDNKEACKGCWAASICAGGCYHEAKIREGDLLSPNLHYCQWIKAWIEIGLNVYGQLMTEIPDFLDKLSMVRGHEPLFQHPV